MTQSGAAAGVASSICATESALLQTIAAAHSRLAIVVNRAYLTCGQCEATQHPLVVQR